MKEEVGQDAELSSAFSGETAGPVLRSLEGSERGRRFLAERLDPHRKEFGNKAIWSHEFVYPTWRENPAPIVETIRAYLATDYDFPSTLAAVAEDLEAARRELLEGVPEGEGRQRLERALELSLRMNPLTPDHHFYIDQATNAYVRLVLVAIGRLLVDADVLDDPEGVMFLRYNELRVLIGDHQSLDAKTLVGERRDDRQRSFAVRPPEWIGTATEPQLAFPYYTLWGFPEKFHRQHAERSDVIHGLGGSPGAVEGVARVVRSVDEFGQVEDGEILVCQMTNPAWVVLFTRIGGLVTDAGGVASHPAVVAREFGLPAVVGTSVATQRIATGDRVRVNGATGVVEVLERAPAGG
jgi:pyruvate,water dikinase